MAYQVDKFNGTFLVSVADGTVDTTTDLRLLGKNYAGYGEVQNENFLHLLENFANTSAPPKAINGQIWFDSSAKKLKYYDADNNKWRTTGSVEVSSSAPLKMNVGDFWYDTSADQLYSWNGSSYTLIGPQASVGAGASATLIAVVKGTDAVNHSIVKLLAGAGDTIAVVSSDEFTLDSVLNPIPGFGLIKKGLTLVNTSSTTGVTTTDHVFWGTSSNAARLGGVLASEFVQKGSSAFTSQVAFTNAGYTVGTPGNNLAVFIELGDQPVIESRNSARITMRIREGVNLAHDVMEFIAPTANPGAAIPGMNSTYDLGTPLYKWLNVYADTFTGTLIGNVTGNLVGVHKGNVTAADDSVAYNATTKNFTGSFSGILTGNVIGDVTGTSSNAFTLNGLAGSTAAVNSTVTLRDSSGNITANQFLGTSTQANALRVNGSTYQTATSEPTANTIVTRDAGGNISANFVNATATAANTVQVDGGSYRTASVSALGNTVVVRDASGNIAVNGIVGAATQANQLQVDGTSYRTASASAIANTIAVRDNSGILRAVSIQNTPIGTVDRAFGGFTSLTAAAQTTLTAGTASTSTTSGTLVVTGGVGVSGAIFAGSFNGTLNGIFNGTHYGEVVGPVGTSTRNAGAFTTLTSNGSTTFTANTASSSTTTGTVIVTGGVGVSGRVTANEVNAGTGTFSTLNFNAGNINGTIGSSVRYSGAFTTVNANDVISAISGIASTSTATGAIVVSGGVGVSGSIYCTSIVETSSIAFKENVNPISDALSSIMQLTGVTYDRKDGSSTNESGLIAEQVNSVLPDVVTKDEDGNPYGVKYTKLIAYLIESVKSLKAEIDDLKSKP